LNGSNKALLKQRGTYQKKKTEGKKGPEAKGGGTFLYVSTKRGTPGPKKRLGALAKGGRYKRKESSRLRSHKRKHDQKKAKHLLS